MLRDAIITLKNDIDKAIRDNNTAECFKQALLSTFPDNSGDYDKIADYFGKIAANYLANALTDPICDAIDKYIRNIGIQITPQKLTSPHGPVVGVISPEEIEIL